MRIIFLAGDPVWTWNLKKREKGVPRKSENLQMYLFLETKCTDKRDKTSSTCQETKQNAMIVDMRSTSNRACEKNETRCAITDTRSTSSTCKNQNKMPCTPYSPKRKTWTNSSLFCQSWVHQLTRYFSGYLPTAQFMEMKRLTDLQKGVGFWDNETDRSHSVTKRPPSRPSKWRSCNSNTPTTTRQLPPPNQIRTSHLVHTTLRTQQMWTPTSSTNWR